MNPLQGHFFPHLCLHTLHTQGRIYMHKHRGYIHAHTQPHADRRGGRAERLPGAKEAVSRLGALLKGTSAVALEVSWHLSRYQLTPFLFIFCPIVT